MLINKMGFEHKEYGVNCQDYGVETSKAKCVVDGCSEGLHSEIGSKLFCELLMEDFPGSFPDLADGIFAKIFRVIKCNPFNIKNFLCFTVINLEENDNEFVVNYCGDGYIIKQKHNQNVEFEKLENGEYPEYFAYNYLPKEYLAYYKNGVKFTELHYSKEDYKNLGVATDGLRYIFGKEFEKEFIGLLLSKKINALKRLINREHKHFKDDITIVF